MGIKKYPSTFRYEQKYYLGINEYHVFRNRVKYLLQADENGDQNGEYVVKSLYFDDYENTALSQKLAGVMCRDKYRIRCYNNDRGYIRLERKRKNGQFINKVKEQLTERQYDRIMKKDFRFLLDTNVSLFRELYFKIKGKLFAPKVVVEYKREAYVSKIGNVRITFDKELRGGTGSLNMFDKKAPLLRVLWEPVMIVEIKFDNFLPYNIKRMLCGIRMQRCAISKYTMCRQSTKTAY